MDGTITAIGQSVFDNSGALYAYLEITGADGGRTLVEKVAVCNDVGSRLAVGLTGLFYVDRFRRSGELRCQLFGLKTDRASVMDGTDLRVHIGVLQILKGIPAILVFGLGLIMIASGIGLLIQCARYDRRRFFFGSAVSPPMATSTVRI
ncbi:hypothetical protein [Bradyrhizobium yuanmingense]|uniref:hypothetical protein n=1 Tax=Bradyrhizobium yuanmingense TaxID=108015 RepID=UPI0023B9511A|nr:hypothetical protein [Bradyrhizobium yuanmingense]MDF0498166.1 hypothetical protein [Bradyrhizobium yuanmingense]